MSTVYFLVQQMMFFSIPLLVVALGGMFSERSGVVNIALEGIMIMGAFSSILFINLMQEGGINLPPQLLLVLAILIAAAVGVVVSLLHAYAAINMKADQVISGTAINMFAPAFAIFVARMIRTVQQIPFTNTFRLEKVPVLGDIPVLGPLLFQNAYITTYLGFAILAVAAIVLYKTKFGLRLRAFRERTANGYPVAEHSGRLLVPERTGGGFAAGDALYSVETTSPEMYAAARASAGPLLVRAAYCESEKQVSRMAFGLSPLGKLDREKLLTGRTVVVGGYQADFFDRERLRTAGATVAMSAVTAMQDGVPFPIVTNLRQDVNTCLNTGYFGLSMLEEMRCAAFGGKLDSNASQFQASDAFYAATIAGAQGLGEPLGRIESGFAADLLLVDPTRLGPHNYPLIELVYRAESADIVGRMVGGRMLSWSAQDLRKSAQAAQAAAQKAWSLAQRRIL